MATPDVQNLSISEKDAEPLTKSDKEVTQEDLGSTLSSLTTSAGHPDTDAHESILAPAHASEQESRWSLKYYIKAGVARLTKDAAYYHYGNYVANRKTGQRTFEQMPLYTRVGMHLLYCGTWEEAMVTSSYAQRLFLSESIKMGAAFDSPDSRGKISGFVQQFNLDLDDLAERDLDKYACFNDFFARALKPGARPVAEPNDETVMVSAADCRLVVFPNLSLAQEFWIKGSTFSLTNLLSDNVKKTGPVVANVDAYAGGSIAIFRLAPQDYHRWHSPVSGKVTSITDIGGALMTVNPMAINENLDVYTQNKRSIGTVLTPYSESPVLVCAIGAMLVGSIVWSVKIGDEVRKGEEMGFFKYGGSTVLVITPKDMNLQLDADLLDNSGGKVIEAKKVQRKDGSEKPGAQSTLMDGACETQVRVGESVGRIVK